MNTSRAIIGLLDTVRNTTLKHFDVLDTYIYDESLDFRGRASQYIAREDVFQQLEGTPPKDWIFIIWNRSSLMSSNYNNRPLGITVNSLDNDAPHADSTTNMRMASLDVEMKIVTNNIEIAETIEEHLYVNTGEFVVYEADYGSLGKITCSAQPDTDTSWEKEDINEVGPVIGIGITININFPVIMPPEIASVIESIDYRLWAGVINKHPDLVEEKIIV